MLICVAEQSIQMVEKEKIKIGQSIQEWTK